MTSIPTGSWKRIALLALALAVALSTTLPPETIARAGVDGDRGDIPSTAEVFRAEQHKTISTPKGDVELDADVTSIAPSDSGEFAHLSAVADQAITDFESSGNEPLLFIETNGKVQEVSKQTFVAKLRKLGQSAVTDLKADPLWLPVLSISRGAVNGIVVGALLLHEGLPHTAAYVGGATAFTLSFLCMLFSTATTDWFNRDKRLPVQFWKGMEMNEVYLAILRLAMLATGHPLDPTFWGSVWHNTTDSLVGNITQEPTNLVIGQVSEEMINAGGNRDRITLVRNSSYFAVSAFTAFVTALHLSPNPHVRATAQWLTAILAVPSTIYLGYKQNWIKSIRAGTDRIAFTLSLGPKGVAIELYVVALKMLGKMKAENPEAVPESIATAAEKQAEDARQEICNGGMSEI